MSWRSATIRSSKWATCSPSSASRCGACFANADLIDPADARRGIELANQKTEEKLNGLLDAKQRARLNQLQLQRQGACGLGRAEIAKQLNLTDEQNERLAKLLRVLGRATVSDRRIAART